jgi:hypothetical protein
VCPALCVAPAWRSCHENRSVTQGGGSAPIPAAAPNFRRTTRQARASYIPLRSLRVCGVQKPHTRVKQSPGIPGAAPNLHDDSRPCSRQAVRRLIARPWRTGGGQGHVPPSGTRSFSSLLPSITFIRALPRSSTLMQRRAAPTPGEVREDRTHQAGDRTLPSNEKG